MEGPRAAASGSSGWVRLVPAPSCQGTHWDAKGWGAGAQSPCRETVSLMPYSRQIVNNALISSAGDVNLLNSFLNFGIILVYLRRSVYQQSHSMSA